MEAIIKRGYLIAQFLQHGNSKCADSAAIFVQFLRVNRIFFNNKL